MKLSKFLAPIACIAYLATPAAAGEIATSTQTVMTTDTLVQEAAHRLNAAQSAKGGLAILLQTGAGSRVGQIRLALMQQLQKHPGIAFTQVTQQPGSPVADANTPGAHVHMQGYVFTPYPDLVVSVSESNGQINIAARAPGRDPLGSADDGWLWVMSAP